MFYFLIVFFRFGKEILLQEIYLRKYLYAALQAYLKQSDESFKAKDLRRIKYYARFVPAVSGASYGVLLNRNLTQKERIAMLFLSAAAPMFDDYFDDTALKEADLREMIAHPETFHAGNRREQVLIYLLQKAKQHITHIDAFMHVCYAVFDAQNEAKKQENGKLSWAEVRKITYDKGGYSTLLFLAVLEDFEMGNKANEEAIYHFGGLVQVIDDMFDIYEDAKIGLQTLATMAQNMEDLRLEFEQSLQKLGQLFYGLPLPKRNVKRFLDLQLFFFTRGCVCLEQLVHLQEKTKQSFNAADFTRKELICDMEKWENIRKWIGYFAHWRKQYVNGSTHF